MFSIAININLFDHFLFYIEMFMYTAHILVTIRKQMIYSHAQRCGKKRERQKDLLLLKYGLNIFLKVIKKKFSRLCLLQQQQHQKG